MGEYQALFKLKNDVKDNIIPYIIIPPVEFDFEEQKPRKTVNDHLVKFPERLKQKWGNRLAILDLHESLESSLMDDGRCILNYLIIESRNKGCKLIPTIDIDKSKNYVNSLRKIYKDNDLGIALRIKLEDLKLKDINDRVDDLIKELDSNINEIDLIIDLQNPDSFQPYKLFANLVYSFVCKLKNWDGYRSFIISGNSLNLSEIFKPGGLPIRHEWMLYPYLVNKFQNKKIPTFSDYTVERLDFINMDMRVLKPSGKLIYTLDNHWRVYKGGAFRGNESQMITHCQAIISSSEYEGAHFSDGDKRINDTALRIESTGNLGTWKQVAINHHMTKAVDQLSMFHVI
ncbi:beta family protein [Acinetobacter indicus]|uniref:beta family protein n=1 Tax=Acinetobacter TaxID=469 RepID=UPI001FD21F41|nr:MULTISPECIES: beta family protein [Acinetobacter]MDM1281936.1 beta family protein [Acinetobacter indicus]